MFNFNIDREISTYDCKEHINFLNEQITKAQEVGVVLMEYAIFLAAINAGDRKSGNVEGGPFGAVAYDPKEQKVVMVGANHVVPENDPTAHAEVVAARNVLDSGRANLQGLEFYSSCECCPMCLAFLLGQGVDKIFFAASRHDAAAVGFSDEKQYTMLKDGYKTCCEKSEAEFESGILIDGRRYQSKNGAVGSLRECCKTLEKFHLPENTVVNMENKPHPYTLVALDWARVGRVRSSDFPDDPEYDLDVKDSSKIQYKNEEFEQFGQNNVEEILEAVAQGSPKVQSIASPNKNIPFEIWTRNVINQEAENAQKY